MKVLCLWYPTNDEINGIRAALPRGTEVVAPEGEYFSRFESNYSELKRNAADADAFIGWALPKGVLEDATKLKLLSWLHAGCDDLRGLGYLKLLKERGAKVANVRGANAVAIAEQGMMFVLALAKNAISNHRAAVRGRRPFPTWPEQGRSAMLGGRTIGIIGVGNIGSHVAKCAKGFGMTVIGVRRNKAKQVDYVDSMHGVDELHSVLARCDYVVVATPNTEETYQFFGKAELAAMKPSAFLINIARANLIQEKPLYEALTSGGLRGFASDVWCRMSSGGRSRRATGRGWRSKTFRM